MDLAEPILSATLARDGSNWVPWKIRTLAILASNIGVMRHIEGTARVPDTIPTFPPSHVLTEEEEKILEKAEKRWEDYRQREAIAKAQIYNTISDGLLIEIRTRETAKQVWDAVCQKHEGDAMRERVERLRLKLSLTICEDDSNVRTHVETLMGIQEQLVGMDAGLPDSELVIIILSSLPRSYRPVINALSVSQVVAGAGLPLDGAVRAVLDEYDWRARDRKHNVSEKLGNGSEKPGRSGNSNTTRNDSECWKCGESYRSRGKKWKKRDRGNETGGDSVNVTREAQPTSRGRVDSDPNAPIFAVNARVVGSDARPEREEISF